MKMLVLNRGDVSLRLDSLSLIREFAEGFRRQSRPLEVSVGPGMSVLAGVLDGIPAFSVNVVAPSSASLSLHDLETGSVLAVMDSTHLTRMRTAVAAALAADALARKDASSVAILGAGPEAAMQLKLLRLVRSLTRGFIYDPDSEKAHSLAARMFTELSLPVHGRASIAAAIDEADIVVSTLGQAETELTSEMVRPGCHVTLLNGGAPLPRSVTFCDDRALAGVDATELREVLTGSKAGRTSREQVTVFFHHGLPFQDLIAAWQVFTAAREDPDVLAVER
jgi:ornithine cyclodeaminase